MRADNIAILMATYNGERFLNDQIDSFLAQSYPDWHLYIHDDGSTDDTQQILNGYAQAHPSKITILDYPPQGNTYLNFMSMLQKVEAPYYMFSDQDDIWHSDKIEKTMLLMTETLESHPDVPVVIHTDLRLVKSNGDVINESFWKAAGIYPEMIKKPEQRITNVVTGCTMLFNQLAKEAALKYTPNGKPLHDEWVTLRTCFEHGIVIPLHEQTIDYRQHDGNVLGAEACYNKKDITYYLTSLKAIYCENHDNYLVLKSAGYNSAFRYLFNKIRNIIVYNYKYKQT